MIETTRIKHCLGRLSNFSVDFLNSLRVDTDAKAKYCCSINKNDLI